MGWGQCSSLTRFALHLAIPVFLEPFSLGAAGVILKTGSKLGSQGIQSGLGAFKMFRLGSQILRMCGILGINFETTKTWDVCRNSGLKTLWIIKGVFFQSEVHVTLYFLCVI